MALVPTERSAPGSTRPTATSSPSTRQNRQRYMVPEQRVLRIARIGPEQVAERRRHRGGNRRLLQGQPGDLRRQRDAGASARRSSRTSARPTPSPRAPVGRDLRRRRRAGRPRRRRRQHRPADPRSNSPASPATRSPPRPSPPPEGAVVGPVRSDLGWHVIKIDDIRGAVGQAASPQARGEIAALLTANKRKEALTDLVTRVEDQIVDGASFAEAVGAGQAAGDRARRRSPPAASPARIPPIVAGRTGAGAEGRLRHGRRTTSRRS